MAHCAKSRRLFAKIILNISLGFTLCSMASASPKTFLTATCHTPTHTIVFQLEIANTEKSREQGLMDRKTLAPNTGMLFVFDRNVPHTFWMKNTYLSLDMIFLNEHKCIVGLVKSAEPLTETPRSISAPSKYVIEIAGGTSDLRGITVGQCMSFVDP